MQKTLSVNAIENGTVIDHILNGQAIRIISLLKLDNYRNCVTIGLNLKSSDSGMKDLIKIEGYFLDKQEQQCISLFAEHATINLIKNFDVIEKLKVKSPEYIVGLFICPNPNCITNKEIIQTRFNLQKNGAESKLYCSYCEKNFSRQEIKEYAR